jgi:hypothetical protein
VDHEGGKCTAREAACWLSPAIPRPAEKKKARFERLSHRFPSRCGRDDGVHANRRTCCRIFRQPASPAQPQTTRFHACRAVLNQSFLFEVLETVKIGRSRLPAYEAQRMNCAIVCVCAAFLVSSRSPSAGILIRMHAVAARRPSDAASVQPFTVRMCRTVWRRSSSRFLHPRRCVCQFIARYSKYYSKERVTRYMVDDGDSELEFQNSPRGGVARPPPPHDRTHFLPCSEPL